MPTIDKRPLKVFLCHAHADRDAVRALYTRLTDDGVDAWLDKEKLLPGQDWELEIRKAVRESDVVIVCLSRQFTQRGFRQYEVRIALEEANLQPEGEIFIIPARLEECEVPSRLRTYHWVDLFEEAGYKRIMLALNEKAKRIEVDFNILKEYEAFTPSDKFFVKEIVAEIEKQEEKPSFLTKIISNFRNFIWYRKTKTNVQTQVFKNFRRLFGVFVLIVIGLTTVFGLPPLLRFELLESTSTPATTRTINLVTLTINSATKTPNTTFKPTQSFTGTPTPLPTEITDAEGVSMVLVPAGDFIMGSDGDAYYLDYDQRPAHNVYLDAFLIDKYEVTNYFYKTCVEAGVCTRPYNKSSNNRPLYYGNSEFDNFPVIYVDWYQAKAYCEWRGARLPTESEWEKAARGTDGHDYPWGDFGPELPGMKANYTMSTTFTGDTVEVGSFPSGTSDYGAFEMAGNVWEWVSDWYQNDYYTVLGDNAKNPQGPSQGDSKVLRGGSWTPCWPAGGGGCVDGNISSFNRHRDYPSRFYYDVGFRCAKDAP